MICRIRWPFLIIALILLLAVGACAYAYFTDYLILHKVTVSPDKYSPALKDANLATGKNILMTPAEDAASYLLFSQPIAKVDLQYKLPDAIDIRLTDFVPIALILCEDRQTLFGLDHAGRLLPVEESDSRYSLPFITGLKTGPLYHKIPDYRLTQVMEHLNRLRLEEQDFYLSLSSIDFTAGDSIMVRIDGLPYTLVMNASGLYDGIRALKQFVTAYNPDLKNVVRLDFRLKDQIIALKEEVKEPVKARPIVRETKKNVRSKNNNRH